jgi:zinc-ribbon domain
MIEMFCPRCGVQIVETRKFCKSCGMALASVMDFVASGGASPFGASSWTRALSGFSSGQKVWLLTLALIFSPILLVAVPFMVPIAIFWMMLQYNLQKRCLAAPASVQTGYFQQPQIQSPPANQLYESRQSAQQPVLQTGSLISEAAPASVVEDETRRLRNR